MNHPNTNSTENLYTTDCIRTFSGLYMNVFDPKPEMICIEDIAHSLAHQCRFGGHLPQFYSVAKHKVYCAQLAEPEHKFQALMHDASEAYLLDIPSPIKKQLVGYKEMEDRMMAVIAQKFGFDFPLSENTHAVDRHLLQGEWEDLMLCQPVPLCRYRALLNPVQAEMEFLKVFRLLSQEVKPSKG